MISRWLLLGFGRVCSRIGILSSLCLGAVGITGGVIGVIGLGVTFTFSGTSGLNGKTNLYTSQSFSTWCSMSAKQSKTRTGASPACSKRPISLGHKCLWLCRSMMAVMSVPDSGTSSGCARSVPLTTTTEAAPLKRVWTSGLLETTRIFLPGLISPSIAGAGFGLTILVCGDSASTVMPSLVLRNLSQALTIDWGDTITNPMLWDLAIFANLPLSCLSTELEQ